jgi:hypothetical protein
MNYDVYTDQMMAGHPSRRWSHEFFQQLKNDLKEWKLDYSSSITQKMTHTVSGQKLIAHVMHDFNHEVDQETIVVTDVVFKNHPVDTINLYPEIFGKFYNDFTYDNCVPTVEFNCFIHRGCPFRQSWIYQLQRLGLLDNGYVSYWCEDRSNRRPPQEHYEELFKENQINQIFEKEHLALREKIPFKNFDISIEDAIINSKLSVVIETFFHNNQFICFSEKMWRSLQLPRPWLMSNVAHAVQQLRDWGFDVLDQYVDHSYDSEPDPITRRMMILEQVKQGIKLSESDLIDLEKRAQHNRTLLKYYQLDWPVKYKKIIETIQGRTL